MKTILKTIKPEHNLNYEETFNSPENIKIRCNLIPELRKSLMPNYQPSVKQITVWLNSLHKSHHSQIKLKRSGRINEDNYQVHTNNQSNDVCNIIWCNFSLITLTKIV